MVCPFPGANLKKKLKNPNPHPPPSLSLSPLLSYAAASRLRDALKAAEASAAAASVAAAAAAAAAVAAGGPPTFRLGQRVTHVTLGYRGVVAGWDPTCMEGAAWRAGARVGAGEAAQPCYHVLVDVRDWEGVVADPEGTPPVAYVPQARLEAAAAKKTGGSSGSDGDGFDHPFSYLLFLGPDSKGDMIPCRALRERFGVERRDDAGPADED